MRRKAYYLGINYNYNNNNRLVCSDKQMTFDNKSWYLLYCKAKEERRAFDNLKNQGVESFFPTMQVEKIIRKKRVHVDTALFPNYLFVAIDEQHANFNSIRSTRGVIDFVKFGNIYTKVPACLVDQLQLKQSMRDNSGVDDPLFNKGETVVIQQGAFKGIEAIYDCTDGLERSMLLINLLNNATKLSIGNDEFASK
ncbi:MAG: transcriptional antiterminator RfaH [Moritella sp.]|jgi:transcriptional antiterminator RfaH